MKAFKKQSLTLLIFLFGFISQSCIDEQIPAKLSVDLRGKEAVFIVNEGNYLSANASVSVYLPQSGEVISEFFFRVNGGPVGDVAQSMAFEDNDAFLIVNNSQVIYRFDRYSGEFRSEITGFLSPRYMAFSTPEKAYVSDLYAEKIYTVDVPASEISGSIAISNPNTNVSQHNAEQLILTENHLFASAWSYDNKVLVFDRQTDTLITKIEVGQQPRQMTLDLHQKLWVMCDGGFEGSTQPSEPSTLYRINTNNFTVEIVYYLESLPTISPARGGDIALNPAKDSLCFIYRDLWKIPVEGFGLPQTPLIESEERLLYALGISPSGEIYLADALNYLQRGQIYRYTPSGELLDSFEAGIIPTFFGFNKD